MALAPGTRLGVYEVTAQIGVGGMGEVYRAIDSNLKRSVALKVLPASVAGDPDRLARFRREAEVLASLNHPNIAAIYGLEKTADFTALVMELVEGDDLSQRIAKGAIPLDEALPIAKQIADALDAAHEQGIVHRDLKPANIKVRSDDTVKVLDFGLAKAMEPAAASSPSVSMSPTITSPAMMTGVGMILGTAAYMSPEQARGKPVDKRADIWAFGAVLFETLTGRRAFPGEDITDTIVSIVSKEPDWRALPSSVPASVRTLLRRCLEKDPKRRLRDIGEAWLQLEAPVVEVAPLRKSGLLPIGVAAASLAIAAAALAWTFLRPASVPDVTRFEIFAPPGTTLPLGTPAVSPDGRTIAFVATDTQHIQHIYIRPLDAVESRELPGTEGAVHPYFSPDGRSLAFNTNRKLTRIDLAGGAPRALADATGPWQGTWSENGTILFQSRGVSQISAAGGPVLPLSEGGHPYFLPDAQRFLSYVSANSGGKRKTRIELHALGSKEGSVVLDDADSAAFITPTPRGVTFMLYMRDSTVMAQQFDEPAGKLVGEPTAILDDVGRVASPAVTPALGVSRSGTLAFQRPSSQGDGRLNWYDRTGKVISQLPSQASGKNPALAPDGQFLAVERIDPVAHAEDIWVVDLKRGTSSRLTFDRKRDRFPIWSPDGKRVIFGREGVGTLEKDASGAGAELLLSPGVFGAYDLSPDEKLVIKSPGFSQVVLAPSRANVASDAKTIPIGLTSGDSGAFRFSPDGKYIAYASSESGRREVYVQSTPPGVGRWQISINGGDLPKWRLDGKELFFVNNTETLATEIVSGSGFSAGPPRTLFRAGLPGFGGYAVSADGQRFLIFTDDTAEGNSPIIVVQNWWAALRK